jgi:hypothetical protein
VFFEVYVKGDGLVRVGFCTESGNYNQLGVDVYSFGFGGKKGKDWVNMCKKVLERDPIIIDLLIMVRLLEREIT